jgi:hypothetical protein
MDGPYECTEGYTAMFKLFAPEKTGSVPFAPWFAYPSKPNCPSQCRILICPRDAD